MTDTPIRKASLKMAVRYFNILFQHISLLNLERKSVDDKLFVCLDMCSHIMDLKNEMYDDKVSRWLGFIQGVMYSMNLLDIETERDYSRPIFHDAYEEMGLEKPKSVSVGDERK